MTAESLVTFCGLTSDMYPRPGERIKQWVVDERREREWTVATCPRIKIHAHLDNTEVECSNSDAAALWVDLNHHCCYVCGDRYAETSTRDDVEAWLDLRGECPPICADRAVLSDEVAPDISLTENPILALLRKP